MRRTDLSHDWQRHTVRTVLTGVVVILVLGVALGAGVGFLLTRALDAAGIDDFARNFSGPREVERAEPR
jgi:hypothetical protein